MRKKALNRTRRVLDSFANRIGDNTWQTVITNEGLNAVKKLLRKTASKNTAVSCFWLRSRSRSELVWVVGNRNKFNEQGVVPVNYTNQDKFIGEREINKHTQVIAYAAAIAGLFHDFGKANILFQNKLDKEYTGKRFEPYRHEWVSLRLFQAFAREKTDSGWLEALSQIDGTTEKIVLDKLTKDGIDVVNNLFKKLDNFAKLVGWLIVSHHRLLAYPNSQQPSNPPSYENIDNWIDGFDALWNSSNHDHHQWEDQSLRNNWNFGKYGTPINSQEWRKKAKELAQQALNSSTLLTQDWFNQRFIAHISRLCLMLSDHYYSAGDKVKYWQDNTYKVYANTDDDKNYKQQLDEHNIGVGQNACSFAIKLPDLKSSLPTLADNKTLKNGLPNSPDRFDWQNKAYKLAKSLADDSKKYGFFGVNMASTGLGKTLGNARIMYALAKDNCRFSVALGLRTLTLQTSNKFVEDLKLDKQDLATLIGSIAVKELHDINNKEEEKNQDSEGGSQSSQPTTSNNWQVYYHAKIDNKILSKWLKKDSKAQKLIYAPILVSTIDHLIPATEGVRGGRQIAPMLRLLTSDLVLDEPDDFGLEDLPALCRLVNWAGMLGSRVLLSTATMPPALAYALFQAYQQGWETYTEVNHENGVADKICCAWFDETQNPIGKKINDFQGFKKQHSEFVEKRIEQLNDENKPILCKGNLLPVNCSADKVLETMSAAIYQGIHQLHHNNNQESKNHKLVSIGLVRMANINPLVAVAKKLFLLSPENDCHIHYCIYHSHYPLAVRSHIESKLDEALNRKDKEDIWQQEEIKNAIEKYPEKNHIFVVLATAVAEVGRDHDYDWAIAEPSSMRSIIQLAGRIQRHRKEPPKNENMLILSKNFKALKNKEVSYYRPGFESANRLLFSHDIGDILEPKDYKKIDSVPRIKKPLDPDMENGKYKDLVQLEQFRLYQKLLGEMQETDYAKYWWDNEVTWCGELQRRQPFRKSSPDEPFCYYYDNDSKRLYWAIIDDSLKPISFNETDVIECISLSNLSARNHTWLSVDVKSIYSELARKQGKDKEKISRKFDGLRLYKNNNKVINWYYHPILGAYENNNLEVKNED